MARRKRPSPDDLAAHVQRRVKQLRTERQLTQAELCEAAGLSLDAVTRIEQGSRQPTLATLAKLASALQVSPADLLAEVAPPSALPGPVARVAATLASRPPEVQAGAAQIVTAFLRSLDELAD